ncbi:MAG TPA: hypothetical protein VHG51_06235 [Longimicrobiaceae bacterium]|nr:hypothetical protein [Longimicrobiaceae bacterium]
MRLLRLVLALPLLAPAALALAACDDATGIGQAVVLTDTITIGAPSVAADTVPSALDVVSLDQFSIGGGVFPERPAQADQWDVALRLQGGTFSLVPPGAVGLEGRRAGITAPIQGVTFEGLDEAPPSSRFNTTTGVPLAVGNVHVVRSRQYSLGGGVCWQYAKVQPVALDAAAGTATLAVATSARCADTRLSAED